MHAGPEPGRSPYHGRCVLRVSRTGPRPGISWGYIAGPDEVPTRPALFYLRPRSGRAVTLPYTDLFIALLGAYMLYSIWERLDSRYPIAGALGLLVVAAVVDAAGATGAANTLAVFVFLLLAGGVVLLLVDHVREGRPTPRSGPPHSEGRGDGTEDPAAQSTDER